MKIFVAASVVVALFHRAGATCGASWSAPTTTDKLSWSYDSTHSGTTCSPQYKCGPESWEYVAAISPTVNMCGGTNQTPIDIVTSSVVTDSTLSFPQLAVTNNGCLLWTQFVTNNVLEVSFSESGHTCTNLQIQYNNDLWTFAQMHTHVKSEHTIDGVNADGELHMVHKDASGNLLVLGFLLEVTAGAESNSFLDLIWQTATGVDNYESTMSVNDIAAAVSCEKVASFVNPYSPYDIIPNAPVEYFTYSGSLTTYPCSEGVTWLVMKEPIPISSLDLKILQAAVQQRSDTIVDPKTHHDNRPTQPLNGRQVKLYVPPVTPWCSSKWSPPTVLDKLSWSYDATMVQETCDPIDKCGPASWHSIIPTGATVNMCGGSNQTPINIISSNAYMNSTLPFPQPVGAGCSSWNQFVSNNVFEVSFSETGNVCTGLQVQYDGDTYTLLQMHTHSKSEHMINGKYADGEIHLVHQSAITKKYLVMGFNLLETLATDDESSSFLNMMWKTAAGDSFGSMTTDQIAQAVACEYVGTTTGMMNPYDMLIQTPMNYFTYSGSLTTYPCSEGITWIVMETPVPVSSLDVQILRAAVKVRSDTIVDPVTGYDNRPIQPLNGRLVQYYMDPNAYPSLRPTGKPSMKPSKKPSKKPTAKPTVKSVKKPTYKPTAKKPIAKPHKLEEESGEVAAVQA